MSASGQYVTAALYVGSGSGPYGIIYSSNYGQTWTQSASITNTYTVICAMSASGQYQIAGSNSSGGTNPNSAFYSTNYGVTWTLANTFTTSFYCVAMSANGQYILGSVYTTSVIQSITRFPPQSITSQSTTTSTALSLLAPNISVTNNVGIVLGRSITSNYATIGFQYIGDNLTTNYVGIGVTAPSTLCITAGGNVGIGTTTPSTKLDTSGTIRALDATYVSVPSGTGLEIVYSGGGNIISGTRNAGSLTTSTLAYQASTHSFYVGTNAGITAMTISTTGATISGSLTVNTYILNYNSTYTTLSLASGLPASLAAGAANNLLIGFEAGLLTTTGAYNVYLGSYAGHETRAGYQNTCVGGQAGYQVTSGINNSYFGFYAGANSTTGSYNTMLGSTTGFGGVTTGSYNTFCGYRSGYSNTSGADNTFIGYNAGNTTGVGTNNIYIGSGAVGSAAGNTNEIVIGNNVTGAGSNTIKLGNSSSTTIYIPPSIQPISGTLILNGNTAVNGSLSVLGTGTNVIANSNITGSNGTLNIVRTGASTNFGTTIHFGLASGSTTASFDNYAVIMGGSNGTLASYTGFICLDVCNAQNSFYGLTTPSNSSIYADTTQIRFNILSSNKMIILANGSVGIGTTTPIGVFSVLLNGLGTNTPNASNTWDAGYALFGPGVGSTTGSAVALTYNTASNYGCLVCLTPGAAWREMQYSALSHSFKLGTTNFMTISTTGVNIVGALSKGSGTFDIEHPLYPNTNKRLVHSFIEGPRCDLIYRGTVALTNGSAIVYIDKQCTYTQEDAMDNGTFEALCANPDIFLQNRTGFNRVVGSIYRGILTITCENNIATDMISWMVVAERKDPFVKNWNRTDSNGYLNTQYTKDN